MVKHALQKAALAWRFARHIPPRKMLRRLSLQVRRKLRLPRRLDVPDARQLRPADSPPLPLFSPRSGTISRGERGWRFTFLGKTVEMEPIDWRAPGAGPEHQLWRMNLHYMEYLESLDGDSALELMHEWSAANPLWSPGGHTDSWNSYALSIRTVVWMQQLARRAEETGGVAPRAVLDSLAKQLLFLETNLETDVGGNHLIKNIKALLWGSAFFEGPVAERWRRSGLRLLSRELDEQLLADGLHYERSASYHAQVLADLAEMRHALGHDLLQGRLDAAIREMTRPLRDLSHPDGGPALFNDSGMTMASSPSECVAAIVKVLGEGSPRAHPVFGYEQAGYFGLRTGRCYLVADMGPIGPDDLPAHSHCDVGSFEMSVDGKRLIVDQGVFEYVAGEKRRTSRATASHNTLALEGAEQAEMFGAFRVGRRPKVKVREWQVGEASFVLEGSHDGYANLPGKPVAARRFEANGTAILIEDRIEPSAGQAASIGFLLHPEAEAQETEGGILIRRGRAAVRLACDGQVSVEPAVYWPDMGEELPTSRLRVRFPDAASRHKTVLTIV